MKFLRSVEAPWHEDLFQAKLGSEMNGTGDTIGRSFLFALVSSWVCIFPAAAEPPIDLLITLKPVPVLILDLKSEDRKVQLKAIDELGFRQSNSWLAVKSLIGLLGSGDRAIRDNAVWALGRIGSPASKRLLKALGHENPRVRENAASALGLIGPHAKQSLRGKREQALSPKTVPALLTAMTDSVREVRSSASYALSNIGDIGRPGVAGLMKLLRNRRADVRAEAARALGLVSPYSKDVFSALVEASQDKNKRVRVAALAALRLRKGS